MEVGALSLLLLAALRLALIDRDRQLDIRRVLLVSAIAGLALLTRNDAVLLFAPVLLYAMWRHGRLVHGLVAFAPLGACAVAQLLFRYMYYGALTPNTYILKMTGVAIGTRLAAGSVAVVDTLPLIAPAVIVIAIAAFAARVPELVRDCSRVVFGTLLVQWAYLVFIGGDAWLINYSNRFIAAVLPALLVAAVAAIPTCFDTLSRSNGAVARFMAVNLLLVFALGFHHPHTLGPGSHWFVLAGWLMLIGVLVGAVQGWRAFLRPNRVMSAAAFALFLVTSAHGWLDWTRHGAPKARDDMAFAQLGLMLRDELPADAVIAAGWVGAPAYFSRLESVDLLGKTDAHVARVAPTGVFRPGHNKMDLAFSLGQLRPDVVLLDDPAAARYGYRRLPNGLWVRGGLPVRRDIVLRGSWCDLVLDSVYCPSVQIADRPRRSRRPKGAAGRRMSRKRIT